MSEEQPLKPSFYHYGLPVFETKGEDLYGPPGESPATSDDGPLLMFFDLCCFSNTAYLVQYKKEEDVFLYVGHFDIDEGSAIINDELTLWSREAVEEALIELAQLLKF